MEAYTGSCTTDRSTRNSVNATVLQCCRFPEIRRLMLQLHIAGKSAKYSSPFGQQWHCVRNRHCERLDIVIIMRLYSLMSCNIAAAEAVTKHARSPSDSQRQIGIVLWVLGKLPVSYVLSGKLPATNITGNLTPSTPAVPNCCCSKGPAPYWSNPPYLIFDIRALWRSELSARAPECQN